MSDELITIERPDGSHRLAKIVSEREGFWCEKSHSIRSLHCLPLVGHEKCGWRVVFVVSLDEDEDD